MLGGNDVGPRDPLQFLFIAVILVFGAITNAILFGNMGVMLQSLSRKSAMFQEKLENANEAMKNLRMPDSIINDVKHYLTYTQDTLDHQKELDQFLLVLSPSLKRKVTHHIFYDVLSENPLFMKYNDIFDIILPDLKVKLYLPEDKIIAQNSDADAMYFIAKGECDVYVTDIDKSEVYTRTLNSSNYFGEVSILK